MEDVDKWIEKADETIGDVLNEKMCSWVCPCYNGANNENFDAYKDVEEEELNEIGRTWIQYDIYDY